MIDDIKEYCCSKSEAGISKKSPSVVSMTSQLHDFGATLVRPFGEARNNLTCTFERRSTASVRDIESFKFAGDTDVTVRPQESGEKRS